MPCVWQQTLVPSTRAIVISVRIIGTTSPLVVTRVDLENGLSWTRLLDTTQMRSLDEVAGDRTRPTPFEHGWTAVWVTQSADFVQLDSDLLWWNNVRQIFRQFEVAHENAFQAPDASCASENLGRSATFALLGHSGASASITTRIGPVPAKDHCSAPFSLPCEGLLAGQACCGKGAAVNPRVGRVEHSLRSV
jgi:hypothetical protein